MYLVDTNVLSDARRGRPEVRAWMRSIDPEQLYLSVMTLGEIMRGIEQRARTDPVAASSLRRWLEGLRTEYAARIYRVDDDVALQWGRIAAIRPRNTADALIAATAIIHAKVLVTRNVADFADLDLPLVDPWRPAER